MLVFCCFNYLDSSNIFIFVLFCLLLFLFYLNYFVIYWTIFVFFLFFIIYFYFIFYFLFIYRSIYLFILIFKLLIYSYVLLFSGYYFPCGVVMELGFLCLIWRSMMAINRLRSPIVAKVACFSKWEKVGQMSNCYCFISF